MTTTQRWRRSSRSVNGSDCVELWRKSTSSVGGSECVELAPRLDAVRDSKNPRTILTVPTLTPFIAFARRGR